MEDKRDKRLDTPSESNTEKHINFLDAEERSGGSENDQRFGHTKEDEERRKEWEQGLEEGRKAAHENNTP